MRKGNYYNVDTYCYQEAAACKLPGNIYSSVMLGQGSLKGQLQLLLVHQYFQFFQHQKLEVTSIFNFSVKKIRKFLYPCSALFCPRLFKKHR